MQTEAIGGEMTFLFLFLLCACFFAVDSWKSKYISQNYWNSSAAAHAKIIEPRAAISSIAVFLLGTLHGAFEFNIVGNEHAFYERAVASRLTWAKHAKVFYVVTGKGGPEDQAFSNHTACRDATKHFNGFLGPYHAKPDSYEVHHCGEPELGMNVLHLPTCEGTYWGPKGPCCRCEGAMLFYLALHNHHRMTHHNDSQFPDWFLFADDDFYVRLNYLEAIIKKPQFPADHSYAVTSSCNFDKYRTKENGKDVDTERQNFGLFRHGGGNCTVGCIHRSAWMGFVMYSIGAMRQLEAGLIKGGLVRTCLRWDVTHDIGVGLHTWMHSIATLEVPMANYGGPKQDKDYNAESLHWHKPFNNGLMYDELFELVVTNGDRKNQPKVFDFDKYLVQETNAGVKFRAIAYPNGLIKNTLFFRKVQLYNAMISQIEETQRPPGLAIDMTDYLPSYCTEDKMMFEAWEAQPQQAEWFGKSRDNHGVRENQMKQCLQYTQYISNLPINVSLSDLPDLNSLLRRKS